METIVPTEFQAKVEDANVATVDPIAAKQSERTALGKTLKLDVGPPDEMQQLAHTRGPVPVRDGLGILISSDLYAKKDCSTCYGRGTIYKVQPIQMATALKLIKDNPANEALMHQSEPGKYHARHAVLCGCARRRYDKKHDEFGMLLVKRGLAVVANPEDVKKGVTPRYQLV